MNEIVQKIKERIGRFRRADNGGAAGSWGMILGGAAFFFILMFVFLSRSGDENKKSALRAASAAAAGVKEDSTGGFFLSAEVDRKAFVERLESQYHAVEERREQSEKRITALDRKVEQLLLAQGALSASVMGITEKLDGIISGGGTIKEEGAAGIPYDLEVVPVAPIVPPEPEGLMLPAGSFVRGTLLTGVYAPADQTTPLPVLIRLNEAFIGPNERRVPLSGAFVIGKATGELNSERVLVQAVSISAFLPDGKVFEHQGNVGYVTDVRGSLGLKGTVIRNTGAKLAATFMSGFLSGAAQGMSEGEVTSTVSDGKVAKNVTGSEGRYAMFQGLSKSAGQLSEYYGGQAEAIVPAVRVEPGVEVYLVILEGVKINGLKDPFLHHVKHLD